MGGSAPWDPSPHREVGGPRCCKVSLPCYSPQPFSQRGFTQTGTDNGSHGSKRCCKSERSSLAEALPTFAGSTERCQEGNCRLPPARASLLGLLGCCTDTPSPREKHSFLCTTYLDLNVSARIFNLGSDTSSYLTCPQSLH